MKALIGGTAILILLLATVIAHAEEPPAPTPEPQPQPQPQQTELYKATSGHVTITCPKEWKDVADKLAVKISAALDKPIAKFGLETKVSIDFQLAVLPEEMYNSVSPQVILDENQYIVHFAMPVLQGTEAKYDINDPKAAGYIYEKCLQAAFAMELPAVQPEMLKSYPRWFWLGFDAYCCNLGAKELLGDESYRLYNSLFGEKKLEFFNEKLLTWNWKEKLDTDAYFGMICAEIFTQIEKQFGPEALVKIGKGLAAAEKADKDSLVKVISDAIGQDFVAWLKDFKCTAKYPVLGFNSSATFAGPGVKADSITEGSAAAEAGFQKDDILVKINGAEIKDNAQFGHVLLGIGPGGKFVATVKRGETEVELTATLKERTTFKFDIEVFPTAPPPTPQDQGPVG